MSYLKQPIEYTFDLNSKSQPKVLCVTHTDDEGVDVIKLIIMQGETVVDLSEATVTARMVMRWTHELLSDNVACTYDSESDSVMIPIDSATIPMRSGEMLVEVNIKSTVNDETLSLQFPLIVRVNGSILDNAEVTPDSRGTIPELLQEVEQELERVKGYVDEAKVFEILDNTFSGNRNISPTLLVDNVVDQTHNPNGDLIMYYIDSDDVRHNIFDFTPYLGTKNYNALQNRPVVMGRDVSAGVNTVLEGYINLNPDGFAVSTYQDPDKEIDVDLAASVPNCWTANYPAGRYDFNNITGTFARAGVFRIRYQNAANKPETINDIVGSCFIIQLFSPADDTNMIRYIVGENANGQIVTYMQTAKLKKIRAFNYEVLYQLLWKKIGEKGDPGAPGADGSSPTATVTQTLSGATISITDATGTTTANILNGSDYILTDQDKSDIADLVLAELPTTQGVQYGNAGN